MLNQPRWRLGLLVCLATAGCGAESRKGDSKPSQPEAAASAGAEAQGQNRNACRLLTPEEIKALEPSIALANVVAEEPTYSECSWEDKDGIALLGLKVYWSGGRQNWETWRMAQGMGQRIMEKEEGVGLDSIVKQGLVPGLGDGAYFSPLLPSLLLKGDVLVEIMMPTVKNPEAKFRPLATSLLGRI